MRASIAAIAAALALTGLLLASGLPFAVAGDDARTVAVLPFAKGAGGAELDGFGAALADMIVTDLSAVPGLLLVERQRLAEVVVELELADSDFIDPASAQQLGHGLGAEFVVVGSFIALDGQLVIDSRMVAVATGAVVKAARAEGAVADFVAIEKEVVERLVDGLDVELSRSDRRRLLLQAPTEDFDAFVSYGRGVKAKEDGDLDVAEVALRDALRRDPDFELAASELASLAALVQREQERETTRYADARHKTMYDALEQLASELTRGDDFRDTRESLLDLSIRQELLRASGQHCQRYDELVHFLLRREGRVESWWEDLHPDPPRRFKEAERLMEARASELGLVGSETWFGTRKGDAMHAAGTDVSSAGQLLTSRNLLPEKFSDNVVHSLERCFPPEVRPVKWAELAQHAEGWGFLDEPLYELYGGGEVTVSHRDAVELYASLLRAEAQGVDAKVSRDTERVLARHPEGDEYRGRVLSRIETIVRAGAAFEGRRLQRMGLSVDALLGATHALNDRSAELLRLDVPLCAALVERRQPQVAAALERFEARRNDSDPRRRVDAGNGLGGLVAPLLMARCFVGDEAPIAPAEVYPMIREALARRHPDKASDVHCTESIDRLAGDVEEEDQTQLLALTPEQQVGWIETRLLQLYRLHTQRCLAP